MTSKMQKYQNATGKREIFRPYEMHYPQWNYSLNLPVRVLIDETGKPLKYEMNLDVIGEYPVTNTFFDRL